MIKIKLDWGLINQKASMRIVYAVVKDKDENILYNGAKVATGPVAITKKSALLGLAEYKSAVMVGSSATGKGNSKDNKNGVCEGEAKVRAFMRVLKVGEGTIGESGYSKNFGGKDFIKDYNKNYKTHPRVSLPFGKSSSDAAGAYQFLGTSYDDLKKRFSQYNIPDFGPESQDKLCLIYLKHCFLTDERPNTFYNPTVDKVLDTVRQEQRKKFKGLKGDLLQLILDNKIEQAALISSLSWASMPNSPYGQPIKLKTYADVKAKFDEYLKDELNGVSDIKIKKGFLREFGYVNCIPLNAPDGIVTYRIYKDGIIEKHIPKTIKKGFENKYKYIYHGSKNVQHEICIVDWHETDEKGVSKSKLYTKPTHSEIVSDEIVTDGQTTRRVKYVNGDIAEYGTNEGSAFWRLYKSLNRKIKLIEMPEKVSFVKYKFSNTQRRYTGPNEFAGFIGALAKTGFEITTTGSCFKEGSCFPSQYHVNGRSVDTMYLWDKEKDQKFIDALKYYHFEELKVGNDAYFKRLENVTDGGNLHDTHLHSGEFVSSKILLIKL